MPGQVGAPKRLIKLPRVCDITAWRPTSVYMRVKAGLMPPPIKLGATRSVAFVEHEVSAVIEAHIAGASDDEIRRLVAELVTARNAPSHVCAPIDEHSPIKGADGPLATQLESRRAKRKMHAKNASAP